MLRNSVKLLRASRTGDKMRRMTRLLAVMLMACGVAACVEPVTFNDDGGWCWFQDERVIVDGGKLIIGSVAAGTRNLEHRGDIDVATYDLTSGRASVFALHHSDSAEEKQQWYDDHNSPAFLVRPDGRIIAMYTRHGAEAKIYYRISTRSHDATAWGEERVFVPSGKSRVTYTNLHLLGRENGGKGRIYDFYRGFDGSFKPSWAWSDDFGETWSAGKLFIDVATKFRHRPYVKYASDGTDSVHIAYTEGSPAEFENTSIYHIVYRAGMLYRSDGTQIRSLNPGLKAPEEGTRVFRGDRDNVAWISDIHLDGQGQPFLVFSVKKDGAGKPPGVGGEDFRYHYARWTGKQWTQHEIAYAGSKLYREEDDYTGNICLDPQEPGTVYISTNADPVTGKPLASKADGERHWELYRGTTRDEVKWRWKKLTRDSTADNIRPVVPIWKSNQRAVLWLEGKMRGYTDYDFRVVGLIEKR